MDIAVVGSNMVDLISYINRMPHEGETVEVVGYDRNKEGCACRDCARFGNCSYNEMTGSCRWYEREDGTDVIFRKVEQVNCLI